MEDERRTTFKTSEVTVLECTAGNFDHDHGEPVSIVTLACRDGKVETVVLNLRDTRYLAVRLLASLHTADDPFATNVLEAMFPYDEAGQYCWPRKTEGGE